ncbi:hypothetical protein [Pyrococcus kukulkanii]|uniref:hypothetical protein n=1 Tax=Pyrococcus kukulkanii TaxID=1609559 RepID=UPI0035615309
MNTSLQTMFILLLVISAVFKIGLAALEQPEDIDVNMVQEVQVDEPNPLYGFLGPLMMAWSFIKSLFGFINAPWIFLQKLGAPQEITLLFAAPWTAAWVFSLISFIRGYRA